MNYERTKMLFTLQLLASFGGLNHFSVEANYELTKTDQ